MLLLFVSYFSYSWIIHSIKIQTAPVRGPLRLSCGTWHQDIERWILLVLLDGGGASVSSMFPAHPMNSKLDLDVGI